MPTDEGIGFENEKDALEFLTRPARKDEQLLAEESILGDELSFASRKIGNYVECNRMTRRLGEMEESLFKRWEEKVEQVEISLERLSKLSGDCTSGANWRKSKVYGVFV